jgi:hypothetical protein
MRWVVHFGMAKTGTTAIQRGLHGARERLAAEGVLYPSGFGASHVIFEGLFRPFERLTSGIRAALDDDPRRVRATARRRWDALLREIETRRPKVTVISCEEFFRFPEDIAGFRPFLAAVSEDIQPCIYVRAPAPYYLSMVNQQAKSAARIPSPAPMAVRGPIETIEAGLGAPMRIRAYEPSVLEAGDSLADFLRHMVEAPQSLADLRGERINETISAEAMSIAMAHRRASRAERDHVPSRTQSRLLALAQNVEEAAGRQARPRLRPEVAEAITAASADLLWLRDARGVPFDGIDYDRVGAALPPEIAGATEIHEICDFDHGWREELAMRVLHEGLKDGVALGELDDVVAGRRLLRLTERGRVAGRRARRWVGDLLRGR